MNQLVIAPILLPLLAGIGLLVLPQTLLAWQRRIGVLAVTLQIVLAAVLFLDISNGEILVYTLGNWRAPFGIALVADRLAAFMVLITALLAWLVLLYALRGEDKSGRYFHVLFQLQLFGLNGTFLTGDLFNLFVFFEVMLLASYGLLLHGGGRERIRAGLHFVVINLVGSAVFLFAIGTLYGVLGSLNMADLAQKVVNVAPQSLPLVRSAGLLLFAVFALKAALFPFYLWLPSAYSSTSAVAAALFAIMTKVGAYSILRIATLIFGSHAAGASNLLEFWLLPLALATLLIGMIGVIASEYLRQQSAYLVVASVGSLLIAFGINTPSGIAAGLYYLPHSVFASAALFLLADLIASQRGSLVDRLQPGPALTDVPLLGGAFFITAIAVIGLPPFAGFIGKLLLLQAALGHQLLPLIMGSVLCCALLGLIALARSGSLLFYHVQPFNNAVMPRHLSTVDFLPVAGLLMLILGITIGAGWLFNQAHATALQLLEPQNYIRAVLTFGAS